MGQFPATRTRTPFDRYYQHYLSLHRTRGCRLLHAAGLMAAGALLLVICWSGQWWALALLPVQIYACAWVGHFFFEGNEPATLRNPWFAFRAYWRMIWDTLVGRRPV
ncbi:MAG TPA: DUF962 domain-containing protein [Gemmataceae bacterium]|jgi:hypothetical protein|nr:DUF962 domain-containing protein [Gemmataceae bacterium]